LPARRNISYVNLALLRNPGRKRSEQVSGKFQSLAKVITGVKFKDGIEVM